MNHLNFHRVVKPLLVLILALALTLIAAGTQATSESATKDVTSATVLDGKNGASLSGQEDDGPVVQNPEDHGGYGNCRYGVAVANDQIPFVDDFHAGWYLTFGHSAAPAENNAEFAPVITVLQDKDTNGNYLDTYTVSPALTDGGLGALIDQRPGAMWTVGNEVDRAFIQGDTFPDVYATAYHEVYQFIKGRDPSAQVAISALVEVTPGRLQYLDIVWDSYLEQFRRPMPVDVWNMHIYILPEKDHDGNGVGAHIALGTDPSLAILNSGNPPDRSLCDDPNVYCMAEHDDKEEFKKQVVAMRTWMKEHGQQNKPLILSEYSLLYPADFIDEYGEDFSPDRVNEFMSWSFNYFENLAIDPALGYPLDGNRLVQQWLWYKVWVDEEGTGGASNLMNEALTQFTAVGQNFRNEVLPKPLTVNLFPSQVATSIASSNGVTATVQISAEVLNNGNRNAGGPFNVTFYSDSALQQPIGSAVIPGPSAYDPSMVGCARKTITASVEWPDLTPGKHRFWVKVDSNGAVAESNEGDNVRSGFVFVDPQQLFLPNLHRP